MTIALSGSSAARVDMIGRSWQRGVSAVLVALSIGCGADADPVSSSRMPIPDVPFAPDTVALKRVEVTTITTGVHLDADGYGILNDEWDYDIGDGLTVPAPTNGTVVRYLAPGGHVLSVVGVASNCRGTDIDDRSLTVEPDADVTRVVFELVCR